MNQNYGKPFNLPKTGRTNGSFYVERVKKPWLDQSHPTEFFFNETAKSQTS